MKKLESTLKNMALVLTLVTSFSVSILAIVNEFTKEAIYTSNMKSLNNALRKIFPEFTNNPIQESDTIFVEEGNKNSKIKFIVYKAIKDNELVATAVESTEIGFSGDVKVLVSFDKEGKILNYNLLSHSETPGLGSKATKWFGSYDISANENPILHTESGKSVIGIDISKDGLRVKKDGGSVDAITGSTITSRAFLKAIENAYQQYKLIKEKYDE